MKDQRQRRAAVPEWVHWAVTAALTLGVAVLDVTKPWDHGFSLFYLVPALYLGWTVQGRALIILNGLLFLTVFLAPGMAAPEELSRGGIRNRAVGVVIGFFMSFMLWDRRRSATALEQSNNALEERVVERTAELQKANHSLSEEIQVRRQAEERLRQAEKMEAIGHLAGGIAHDFNNLLTVINGYANLLRQNFPPDSPCREGLEQIASAGLKAADVTHKLLAFSRRQVLQPAILDLNEVVVGMEKLLGRLLPENIVLATQLDKALGPIRADRNELERALMNLTANARDAMPGGGEFRLTTAQVILTDADVANLPDFRPGPHARLTASDTGCGMDETTRQRIFEPFFTTKDIGKGTGLGLASVYGVINQSGGHIDVVSEIGRGTTFTILLPCVLEQTVRRDEEPDLPKNLAADGETILLVEDDVSVSELTEMILKDAGYTVLTACEGSLAAGMMARQSTRIDLLITDVVLPEMSGPELAALAARERPGIKVLFVSGYAVGEALSAGTGVPRIPLLTKPYSAEALTAKVGELLHL